MQVKFVSNTITPRSVRIEFVGDRYIHFIILTTGGVLVHYFDGKSHCRPVQVMTDEVSKDARKVLSAMYSVHDDDPGALNVCVDVADPAMTTIRGILNGDKPDEKFREMLAAACDAENWPRELKDTLKHWIQADDEAEGEVPIGRPDPEFDNTPETTELSLADVVNPQNPTSDRWPVS